MAKFHYARLVAEKEDFAGLDIGLRMDYAVQAHIPQQTLYCEVPDYKGRPGWPRTNWGSTIEN